MSNVIFCNGAVVNENNDVFIYYASSDTRIHIATTTLEKLVDYTFNTPEDPYRSLDNALQRKSLIERNEELLKSSN
ncbi:4-O-beta-D-mannosyl-D-glucose phosphorylase [compost metagenome]